MKKATTAILERRDEHPSHPPSSEARASAPPNPKARASTILDLRTGQCRWEITGSRNVKEYLFCGAPVWDGTKLSFCREHYREALSNSKVNEGRLQQSEAGGAAAKTPDTEAGGSGQDSSR
jgi:hypothetical protein